MSKSVVTHAVFSTLLVVIVAATLAERLERKYLKQLSTCACEVGEDEVVDLSLLAFRNNTPRFRDLSVKYPFAFSWNPCRSFSEGGHCQGVAGCQMVIYPRQYFSLGTQRSAKFLWSPQGDLHIMYHVPEGRTLYVKLMCTRTDTQDELEILGERPEEPRVYDMVLRSKHACPYFRIEPELALSIGSILLITAMLILLLYFAVGVAFQIFVRKASGLEVIPNSRFWTTLPGLVKDGTLFVVRRGKVNQMYQTVS